MAAPAFLPSYILSLLNPTIKPNKNEKRSNRVARNPPLSLLTKQTLPKPPTLHKFTRRIPKYLNNVTFLRNGSGVYTYPHKSGPPWIAHHLFDGIAVTHSLTLSANSIFSPTVTHTSDFVDHHFLQSISNTSQSLFAPVQVYHPATFQRMINLFARDLAHNILYNLPVTLEHIPTIGTVARSDVSTIQQIHPVTLSKGDRIRFVNFNSQLRGQQSASHGTVIDGYYYNYVADPLTCNIFSISPSGETKVIAKVHTQTKLVHAIVATENYIILPHCPCTIDIPKFLLTKSIVDCVREQSRAASFIVIDRHKGGIVAEFCAKPFFMFHFINAYEDGDDLVIDTCAYQNTNILNQLRVENLANDGGIDSAMPTRFILKGISQARITYPRMVQAEEYAVSDACIEFPTVNPNFRGRKNRYAYGIGDCDRQLYFGELVKLDMETGQVKRWKKKGLLVGEPVFVPRGDGREDDGCLLVVVTREENKGDGGSALVVIDARRMTEISRAELGFSIAIGFHASVVKYGDYFEN